MKKVIGQEKVTKDIIVHMCDNCGKELNDSNTIWIDDSWYSMDVWYNTVLDLEVCSFKCLAEFLSKNEKSFANGMPKNDSIELGFPAAHRQEFLDWLGDYGKSQENSKENL